MTINRKVVLASRPNGAPVPANFRMDEAPVPEIRDGEALVRVRAISMEPAIRGWLDDNDKNYFEPIAIGGTMLALSMGQVVASKLDGFQPGDFVRGMLGWEDYSVGQRRDRPAPEVRRFAGYAADLLRRRAGRIGADGGGRAGPDRPGQGGRYRGDQRRGWRGRPCRGAICQEARLPRGGRRWRAGQG